MIKVYSTQSCTYCQTLKEWLKDNKIEFESYDVGADEDARNEMVEKAHTLSVPVLDIDGQIIVGFDLKQIKAILKM